MVVLFSFLYLLSTWLMLVPAQISNVGANRSGDAQQRQDADGI
jgi:hypothetical protein